MWIVKISFLFQLSWHHFLSKDWNEAGRVFLGFLPLMAYLGKTKSISCFCELGYVFFSKCCFIKKKWGLTTCTGLPLYYDVAIFCSAPAPRPCCLLTVLACSSIKLFIHILHSCMMYHEVVAVSLPSKVNSLAVLQETILFWQNGKQGMTK